MTTPAVTEFTAYLISLECCCSQVQGAECSQKVKDLLYASCKPEGFVIAARLYFRLTITYL